MKKIFIATMITSALFFTACGSNNSKSTESASTAIDSTKTSSEQPMMSAGTNEQHAMLGVKGNCDQCKERIEKAAKSVNGVSMAIWDNEKQEIHLNFDPAKTNVDAISKVIAKAGYDTDKDKANQTVYDALPSCCKYKR